jgi:hypothetical protein
VAVWRELRRIGAVSLGQCRSWLAPDVVPVFAEGITRVIELAQRGAGEVVVLEATGRGETDAARLVVGLLLVSRRLLAWVGVLAALLIAFSRLYLGVHYPHDTVAGLVLGVGVSLAGWLVVRVVLTRLAAGLQRTPIRPLLASGPARTSAAAPATPVSG